MLDPIVNFFTRIFQWIGRGIGLLIGVLKDTADPAAQADLLKGMNAAMEGKRNVKMPAGWQEVYAKTLASAVHPTPTPLRAAE